jgi:hypothetical protein
VVGVVVVVVVVVVWGCQLDFDPSFNGLVICCCDAQPAGLCISHGAQTIEVNQRQVKVITKYVDFIHVKSYTVFKNDDLGKSIERSSELQLLNLKKEKLPVRKI